MSFNVINPYQQFIDTTGKVRVSGIVTFFNNRTTVKASIFSDESLSVAQTNPYTLNANGQIAGDVKYSGLLTIQESNSDGSDIITTNDVPTIGDQTKLVAILGSVAGTNTITATGTPTITSLVDLTIYSFTAANAITGATTLQIDATAAKSVLKYHDQPLISGDIEANQTVSVIYNSTDDVFELISSTLNPQIQSITATVAASALTLGLNPTSLYFRKTPLTDGTPNVRSNAAISLIVPSTATLGTTNAVESRLILLAIDNAGTVELAVINRFGSDALNEDSLITTVTISTGSDLANVFYSTTARTSVPFRVVGFVDSTQATAGTWDTSPTVIQGAGGNSLKSIDNPLQVTNHIRAGNTQIWDGDGSDPSNINDVTALMAANTFETFGPTGSFADNIWTAMDVIPANATILIIRCNVSFIASSAAQALVQVYAQEGNATAAASAGNRVCFAAIDFDASKTGTSQFEYELTIPLASDNQDFRMTWASSDTTSELVGLRYKGFMTD